MGCLTISRVKQITAGEILAMPSSSLVVSQEDETQWREISDAAMICAGNRKRAEQITLMTAAMDYESTGHCPALGDDKRCTIHDDRKPAVCSMVPFEANYPDGLQSVVLLNRQLEENCIVDGFQEGFPVVVRQRKVKSEAYLKTLTTRRNDLRLEKFWWGNAVFSMLRSELFENPAQFARIPADGLLSLSIVPVLAVLAAYSSRCRDRCLQYIDRQTQILDHKIDQAISRKSSVDKPVTREFRAFKQAYSALRPELENRSFRQLPRSENRDTELEKYLGI